MGFDDVEHATIVTPALTTVRQPLAERGRTAVSLLSRPMERQSFETLHVELATRLVVRDIDRSAQKRLIKLVSAREARATWAVAWRYCASAGAR